MILYGHQNRVMVVNDDQIQNLICRKVFQMSGLGITVKDYIDPLVALEEIKADKVVPKFILLDVNMPELSGWEFLEELKRVEKEFPVVMFTASVDEEDRDKADTNHMVKMFMDKPLTKEKVFLLEPLLN